jgi:membrane dipeptidase
LIDCHSDIIMDVETRREAGERNVLGQVHLPDFKTGNIGAAICTVGGDPGVLQPLGPDRTYEGALMLLDMLDEDVAESDGAIEVVLSAAELCDAAGRGVFPVVPCLEGAMPFEGSIDKLEHLVERGVRSVGLVHNTINEASTGIGKGTDGLSDFGHDVVRRLNDLGVIVDATHINPEGFWGIVETSRTPIIASHSNAIAVHDHPRNLDDAQLKAVADSGGMIGLVLYGAFVGPSGCTIEHALDHADYMLKLLGDGAVGIGADYIDYAVERTKQELEEQGIVWTPGDFEYPEGVSTFRELGNLLPGLAARGHSEASISNVAGENFLRVWEDVERAAAPA